MERLEMEQVARNLYIMAYSHLITRQFALEKINIIKYGKLTCELCKCRLRSSKARTIDYIIPKHIGGTNHIDNLQLTHKACNKKKGHKLLPMKLEWGDKVLHL